MKKYIIIFLSVFTLSACTDKFEDFNQDVKNPVEVPADALFTNATIALFDFMTECNVNRNNFRLWAQQWAQTTYPDESNYQLVERDVNGYTWNRLYATVIRDLRAAKEFTAEDQFLTDEQKAANTAIYETMIVFAYHVLVDVFGDIPYSAAFDADNLLPAYDNDADIYTSLIDRLDVAISDLDNASTLGGADLVYGGSTSSWGKFANSLKLRLAIRIADTNDAKAGQMVSQAVAAGVFSSSSDNLSLTYESTTPNTNPLWESLVQSGRSDFIAANTLVDVMNGLDDPRRGNYFTQHLTTTDTIVDMMTMDTTFNTYTIYVGGTYGDSNSYTPNSQPGDTQEDPTFPGTVMDYTEVLFLLADAAERGYNVGGTAEDLYHEAIQNSILDWGGSVAEATDYLANPAVAYSTAEGDWKQKIATQKWIALYDKGFEAWSTYRLYDAPEMNVAVGAGTLPPTRFTYPVDEYSLNGPSVESASTAIGGDDLFSKVFWDVN